MGKPKPLGERLAAARDKHEKLKERISALEAKARAQSRRDDTRRKVLVGATIIAQMEKDPAFARMAARYLDEFIQKPKDRELLAQLLGRVVSPTPANTSTRPVHTEAFQGYGAR